MKKLQIFALAALVAIGFSSCIKEQDKTVDVAKKEYILTIKMANSETRAIGAPGALNVSVTTGRIIVFTADGSAVVANEAMNSTFAAAPGQEIATAVPAGAQVYVIANGPASVATFNGSLAALKAVAANVSFDSANIENATLVNVGGNATAITQVSAPSGSTPGTATATVTIAPAFARIELASVVAKNLSAADKPNAATLASAATVTSLANTVKVTGVYLNSYYPQFTMGAGAAGTIVSSNDVSTLEVKDVADVNFTSGVAANADGKVWGYNVAASSAAAAPKLHVTINNPTATGQENKTISIKSYGNTFGGFEAGKIYRIAALNFPSAPWNELPNEPTETDYELTVTVEVQDWEEVTITPELEY